MKKGTKILYMVLCFLFVCLFALAAFMLISRMTQYKHDQNYYNDIGSQYSSAPAASPTVQPITEAPENSNVPIDEMDPEISPKTIDFSSLRARCADVQSWIYLPDTPIDYPVVQCDDNMYYLHRDIDGNTNSSGSIFVECLCAKNLQDTNTIIYGHHMKDGSMFAKLVYYNTQEFYEGHPYFYINTPDKNYRCEIFSGYVTNFDSDTYKISFSSDQEFINYINSVKSQSLFKSDVEVIPGDKIVTLSTCTYDYDDARFVVQAKLVPIH